MLKLISRQNMAVLATICIIGVLCNPDYFDSILDTYQGRIILVGFIILLSYENPVLGTIVVKGLTTLELTDYLETNLKAYLVAPIVNIQLINFKISVMGDVKSPGAYTVPNERITILEALVLAGDLTIQGKRKNVLLIREIDGKKIFITLDLTNRKLFKSPYYYLAQNDVIYVEPNKARLNSSAVGSNTGVILSSVSILITLLSILTR